MARIGVRPPKGAYAAKNAILEVVTPERQAWRKVEQSPPGAGKPRTSGNSASAAASASSSSSPARARLHTAAMGKVTAMNELVAAAHAEGVAFVLDAEYELFALEWHGP